LVFVIEEIFCFVSGAVKAMHGDNVREAEASEENKEASFGSKVKGG